MPLKMFMVFPSVSVVRNLTVMQEMQKWVRSLGWEDPLKKEMATHSSILACEIPWTEEPGSLQSMGPQRVRHDWACMHVKMSIQCFPHSLWLKLSDSHFYKNALFWFYLNAVSLKIYGIRTVLKKLSIHDTLFSCF